MTVMAHRSARWAGVEITDLDPQPRTHQPGQPVAPGAESVAAPSRFANPFEVDIAWPAARMGALVQYGVWLARQDELLDEVRSLAGRDLSCTCALSDPACHRNVLLDVANPPPPHLVADGRAMGLTVRRPWASLLLVPGSAGGKTVENRTWATDYRGPVLIYAGEGIDEPGVAAARRANFDADWHTEQRGWLGAAVLIDVHPARHGCCRPWGQRPRPNSETRIYHWVFEHPYRRRGSLKGRGFQGLRPTSWSVLVRRGLLGFNDATTSEQAAKTVGSQGQGSVSNRECR